MGTLLKANLRMLLKDEGTIRVMYSGFVRDCKILTQEICL